MLTISPDERILYFMMALQRWSDATYSALPLGLPGSLSVFAFSEGDTPLADDHHTRSSLDGTEGDATRPPPTRPRQVIDSLPLIRRCSD